MACGDGVLRWLVLRSETWIGDVTINQYECWPDVVLQQKIVVHCGTNSHLCRITPWRTRGVLNVRENKWFCQKHHNLPTVIDLKTASLSFCSAFVQFPACFFFSDLLTSLIQTERPSVLVMQHLTSLCSHYTVSKPIPNVSSCSYHRTAVSAVSLSWCTSVLHSSIFPLPLDIVVFSTGIFFRVFLLLRFVSQREDSILPVRTCVQVCNQKERVIYMICHSRCTNTHCTLSYRSVFPLK